MVLGGSANNISCTGNLYSDEIYLVSFLPITNGTALDLTDNGWERAYPDYFGTTEGVYRFIRNGGTIPAGTVFKFRLRAQVSQIQQSDNPGWSFSSLNGNNNTFDFSTSGDQLFLLQGGNWSTTGIQHQGSYAGGKLLFAYNSINSWAANNGSTGPQRSNLPDELQCYHITPNSGTNSFRHYSGPETPVSKAEWMVRIHNPANWTNESFPTSEESCSAFNSNFTLSNITIKTNTDTETVCQNEDTSELTLEYSPNVSYQWFSNTTASTTGGTLIPGETNNSFTPPSSSGGTTYYYCEITINISLDGSTCTPYKSNLYQVNINPAPITSNIVQH